MTAVGTLVDRVTAMVERMNAGGPRRLHVRLRTDRRAARLLRRGGGLQHPARRLPAAARRLRRRTGGESASRGAGRRRAAQFVLRGRHSGELLGAPPTGRPQAAWGNFLAVQGGVARRALAARRRPRATAEGAASSTVAERSNQFDPPSSSVTASRSHPSTAYRPTFLQHHVIATVVLRANAGTSHSALRWARCRCRCQSRAWYRL